MFCKAALGVWFLSATLTVATAVPALAGPQPGQIVIDPDHPMWLQRYGGRHVYICGPGDPEDFLYRGQRRPDGTRDGDQDQLIRKLIENGGNCIYMEIVRSHGGDGKRDHNPFVDSDPAEGLSDPILTQWEQWFRLMDEHGILIYLFFYDDGAKVWDTQDRVGDEEKAFVEGIVQRFKHHRNLIWLVGEESEEAYSHARVVAIAETIRRADPFGHEVGNHHLSGTTFKAFVPGGPLTHYAMQCTAPIEKVHAVAMEAWHKALGRYQVIYAEDTQCASNEEQGVRRFIWASAMVLQEFFESTDFQTMSPHDELAGDGALYALADPDRSYILYAEHNRGGLGALKLPAGRYDLRWLDCVTGKTVEQKGRPVGKDDQVIARPEAIGEHCALWLLRTDAADTRPATRPAAAASAPGRSTTQPRASVAKDLHLVGKAGEPIAVQLQHVDAGGPGPYNYTIINPPRHGKLGGSNNDRVYTSNAGFSGTDSFTWKVHDGRSDSNPATVTLDVAR
jgi:hypothetical protein